MAAKKDSDEKRVDELSDKPQQITVGSSQFSVGGNIASGISVGGQSPSDLRLFIQMISAISNRHSEKRGPLSQLIYTLFREKREIQKVTSILELKDLITILSNQNFYKTAEKEKQEKYIRIMLDYLVRAEREAYHYLVGNLLLEKEITLENRYQTDVITKLIMQRLAGDITTDAPPPEKKKKKRRG